MKRLSAAVLLYLGLATAALAQTTFTMPPPAGVTVVGVQVVTSCGSASLTAGGIAFVAMDTTGKLCDNGGGGGGSTTANQGTANTLANAWPFKITDATNGPAAVKPASTAAAATDPGLVVDISPNGINPNGSTTSVLSAPVVIASDQAPVAVKGSGPAAVSGAVPFTLSSQYPTNATTTTPTAVTATATGTTGATAATLAAVAGVTNFVCGFTITADATALAVGTATLSGTVSGSLNYLQTILAATSGTSVLPQNFNPCIPASAANTAITITSAAAGTGGNTIVNIWGYRL